MDPSISERIGGSLEIGMKRHWFSGNRTWIFGALAMRGIAGLALVLCLSLLVSAGAHADERAQKTGDGIIVVLDPGHGGEELGTENGRIPESRMNLETALAAAEELRRYEGITVYLTRTGDETVSIRERADFAASVNADFVLSIHYNASESHRLYGTEVWVSLLAPYNAYGYQFGELWLREMEDEGMFLRGIKTRRGNNGDYYGILRYSVEYGIPAAIVEHCHVDEARDAERIAEDAAFGELGVRDATAIARYFGLRSAELGVDYSSAAYADSLPAVSEAAVQALSAQDTTAPDVCLLELSSVDRNALTATFTVSAADYDGMLLYYDYSTDGGVTYSPLFPWEGADISRGTSPDTFSMTLEFQGGERPSVAVRAYNRYDLYAQSDIVTLPERFPDAKEADEDSAEENGTGEGSMAEAEDVLDRTKDVTLPQEPEEDIVIGGGNAEFTLSGLFSRQGGERKDSAGTALENVKRYLLISIFLVASVLVLLLILHIFLSARKRKRNREKGRKHQ